MASRTDLKNKAVNVRFYDARPDKQGLLSASTILPGATSALLKDINFGVNAYILPSSDPKHLSNIIVLKANFFTLPSYADQKVTLLHELLHYAYDKDDVDLARLFGILDPNNRSASASSTRISDWLKADCDKSKLK